MARIQPSHVRTMSADRLDEEMPVIKEAQRPRMGEMGGGKSMRIAGYMGVSENSGTPKSSILIGYKPSNLGYPYFWKHLYLEFLLGTCESISQSRYVICRFFWDPDPASSDLFKRSGISDKLVRWMVPLWSPL